MFYSEAGDDQHVCTGRATSVHSSPTIVVPVQTLERQPQLLLVLFQVFGELVEVQTAVFVLITR